MGKQVYVNVYSSCMWEGGRKLGESTGSGFFCDEIVWIWGKYGDVKIPGMLRNLEKSHRLKAKGHFPFSLRSIQEARKSHQRKVVKTTLFDNTIYVCSNVKRPWGI